MEKAGIPVLEQDFGTADASMRVAGHVLLKGPAP